MQERRLLLKCATQYFIHILFRALNNLHFNGDYVLVTYNHCYKTPVNEFLFPLFLSVSQLPEEVVRFREANLVVL